jgi:hypothetical protein
MADETHNIRAVVPRNVFHRLRHRSSDPPGFREDRVPGGSRSTSIRTDEGRYTCHAVDSASGRWTLAYGVRPDAEGSRLFRVSGSDVTFTAPARQPVAGSIADDGTMAVVDKGSDGLKNERLRVFVGDATTVERSLDATVSDVVARADGEIAALTTRHPDATVRTYDTESGELVWSFSPRREIPRLLGYHGSENLLYVAVEPREEPYLALDASGEVAWGSERYRSKRQLAERIRDWFDRD